VTVRCAGTIRQRAEILNCHSNQRFAPDGLDVSVPLGEKPKAVLPPASRALAHGARVVFGTARLVLGIGYLSWVTTPLLLCVPSATKFQTQECVSIILQHIKSGLYFQGPGTWTRQLGEAFDFGHTQRAMGFARQHRLTGVQVIVAFIDSDQIETHLFPIESPSQMPAVATAA